MHSRRIRTTLAATLAVAVLTLTGCGSDGGGSDQAAPAGNTAAPTSAPAEPTESEKPSEKPSEKAEQIVFKPGDNSDEVRELQARLVQAKHLKAVPNGNYGPATEGAVTEFQSAQKLKVTGVVYASTWEKLKSLTKTPTQDELHPKKQILGHGDNSDQVRELQARLKQLGHFKEKPTGYYGDATQASVKAYQQSVGIEATGTVYEDTWEKLTSQTRQPTQDELKPPVDLPEVDGSKADLDDRCMTGRVLCISKTSNKMAWMIDGKVYKLLDVRFGAKGYETREGVFSVYWKSRDHVSTIYDSPMPFAMFFDGGQAVHYSENFAQNGYTGGSYGCVNVRDYNGIKWLFDSQVKEGDKVVIHW
ncbi:L,D-transpeptidase family protein [Streptomyces indicus]|uniref:Peptidoglycan-binding (PGRP) domain of peptidoglycan hydrolases-containing protein n=1 Tax=Streptomyces indicus TaxID=417292 RepID=A0A1G9BKA0_9ACTN|nr:peptidoglycan-binding protein [Streptomyces indicus]SDK39948.1 Peptidoglycan-binding (PGRP) domain of peptidoglycan hydrolases-containing protein [Streptomyces indicus]